MELDRTLHFRVFSFVFSPQVTRVCGTNVPCQYDYMVTLVAQVAEDTLQVQAWTQQQVEHAQLGKRTTRPFTF